VSKHSSVASGFCSMVLRVQKISIYILCRDAVKNIINTFSHRMNKGWLELESDPGTLCRNAVHSV